MADAIYGKIQGLPDNIEPAVRVAKYSVFELRWPKRTVNDLTFIGPFPFIAQENEESGDVRVKWQNKGDRSVVQYIADDSGLAICWLPDDRYWHNRLYLMDQPQNFPLVNYHTPNGTYPASYIQLEIDCLKRALKTMVPIYQVLRNGNDRGQDFFHTEAEAKKCIERQAKAVTKITKDGIINESTMDADYTIEVRQREEYRPEITELAKINRRLPWGWTSCPKFMNEIKPRVMAEVEKIRKTMPEAQSGLTKQSLMNAIRGLTPEEKAELLGVVPAEQKVIIPEVQEQDTPVTEPELDHEETFKPERPPEPAAEQAAPPPEHPAPAAAQAKPRGRPKLKKVLA